VAAKQLVDAVGVETEESVELGLVFDVRLDCVVLAAADWLAVDVTGVVVVVDEVDAFSSCLILYNLNEFFPLSVLKLTRAHKNFS